MPLYTKFSKLFKKDPVQDGNSYFDVVTMLNDNWDKLEEVVQRLTFGMKGSTSGTDINGIDTIVEYFRQDDTLFLRKTLSEPNIKGQYQRDTWEFFDDAGTGTPVLTLAWTYGYRVSDNSPKALPNSWSYMEVGA